MKYIDFRSDTVTWPTPAMRQAMAAAPVGDDVYGDDPTVNELEALAAEMSGKEAALFVPSGTFGNQLALFAWCPRGSEVILGEQCHIVQHEAGAASVIAGVQTRTVFAPEGIIPPEAIEERIRGDDIHYPPTSLICLENAHSSGRTISLSYMKEVSDLARRRGLPVHLDGARLFNAASALGVSAPEITRNVDSVMFCLSKGLCAPVGSMLAGPADFIARARRKRKIMGGGLRQAGVLAAAGLIALGTMAKRLGEDHENAKYLASRLPELPGCTVLGAPDINMVFFTLKSESAAEGMPQSGEPRPAAGRAARSARRKDAEAESLPEYLRRFGIVISPPEGDVYRFVTHYWIKREHIDKVISHIGEYVKQAGR